jgi:hypothetical protein
LSLASHSVPTTAVPASAQAGQGGVAGRSVATSVPG